jgi:hypothetical protein
MVTLFEPMVLAYCLTPGKYVIKILPPCSLVFEKWNVNLNPPLQYLKLLPTYIKVLGKKQLVVKVEKAGNEMLPLPPSLYHIAEGDTAIP